MPSPARSRHRSTEARVALEAYVEQPDNVALLQRCRTELTQVQGVLRVMEIHGAALLAEEMHQVCAYLEATIEATARTRPKRSMR